MQENRENTHTNTSKPTRVDLGVQEKVSKALENAGITFFSNNPEDKSIGNTGYITPTAKGIRKDKENYDAKNTSPLHVAETYPYEQYHIKYASNRSIPYILSEEFPDFQREYEILQNMYSLDPEHVVRPLSSDEIHAKLGQEMPKGEFYITERFEGISLHRFLDTNRGTPLVKHLVEEIKTVIETFHRNNIVHGDLLPNILVNDTNGIIQFKIIDPVAVPEGHPKMREFMEKDISDIETLLETYRSETHITPTAPEGKLRKGVTPTVQNQAKKFFSFDEPSLSYDTENIYKRLSEKFEAVGIDPKESIREKCRKLGIRVGEFLLQQLELAGNAVKLLRKQLEENQFINIQELVYTYLSSLSNKEKVLLTNILIKHILVSIERQKRYFYNAQEMIRKLGNDPIQFIQYANNDSTYDQRFFTDAWYSYENGDAEVVLMGSAIGVIFKDNESFQKILNDDAKNKVGGVAITFKPGEKGEFRILFCPPNERSIVHEVRHATVNPSVFHEKETSGSPEWHLKEEIIAYLSNNESIETIHDTIKNSGLYDNTHQVRNFEEIFKDLLFLERKMGREWMIDILSIVPLEEWHNIVKLVGRRGQFQTPETPERSDKHESAISHSA